MLVDVFGAIIDLRPLGRHRDRSNAFARVNWKDYPRGYRSTVKIDKSYAISKICSELVVVFFFFPQFIYLFIHSLTQPSSYNGYAAFYLLILLSLSRKQSSLPVRMELNLIQFNLFYSSTVPAACLQQLCSSTAICDVVVSRCREKTLPGQDHFSPQVETTLSTKALIVVLSLRSC